MIRAVFLDAATVAAERIAKADIVITNKVRIGKRELAAAARLKLIIVAATGYDIIDVEAAQQNGVAIANSPGYSLSSLPEHAVGLMFAVARSIVPFARAASDGTWTQASTFCLHNWPIIELRGLVLGIIGSGSLGRATGKLCAALGMRPIYLERKQSPSSGGDDLKRLAWDELLATCDIISLHCPLAPDNRHMFNGDAFAQMKNSAILINTARGALVDAAALVAALEDGQIAGAGIDVLDQEPPPATNPLISCSHPALVVTPHVAWASRQAQERLLDLIAATADAFMRGQPQHLVA